MTKRVVLGPRANGDVGLFVSPPGVDADTAADSALRLSVTSKVSQLLTTGLVSGSATIPLGLSRSPFVFITSRYDFSSVIGHVGGPGPIRPSVPPLSGYVGATAVINSNGVSLSVTSGTDGNTYYQVYSQAFT